MANKLSASFRDPSGFLFTEKDTLYRQVNKTYQDDYQFLKKSGLYKNLVGKGLLIPHQEVSGTLAQTKAAYKVIKPTKIPFISYPYEWSFSQLKDAALTTLEIQKIALGHSMSLKDASAFNIQFFEGKPVLIDTLSFEKYKEGEPWVAYKQFCQHFLAPLALMSYTDVRLNRLFQLHIDGVPLDLTAKLLPLRTKLKPSLLIHIHLHAASQKRYANKEVKKESIKRRFSKRSFLGIVDSLEGSIKNLNWKPKGTEWADYYPANNNYLSDSLKYKSRLVEKYIDEVKSKSVWDFGANTGLFSRIASDKGIPTISFDIDPAAVEQSYITVVDKNEKDILPLVIDLTNPSPSIGWNNSERSSFFSRGKADTALALALIHHLAISNNLPLDYLAKFFQDYCNSLIIEYVPKEDSQVKKLLASREDIFPNYTQSGFESSFGKYFSTKNKSVIKGSKRTLYLMIKK